MSRTSRDRDPRASDASLLAWWLGAIFFTSLAALLLIGGMEWEHYRRILKLRYVTLTVGDRAIVAWLLWAKSVLPLMPVLLIAGLVAASGRKRLASGLLAAVAILFYFWLAADLVLQQIVGSHVLDYLPYLHDALVSRGGNHAQWAGDTLAIVWRSLLVLTVVSISGVCVLRGSQWLVRHLLRRFAWIRGRAIGVACTTMFVLISFAAVPAQALFSHPLLLRRLHTAMPVDLTLFVPRANDPATFALLLGRDKAAAAFERGVRIVGLMPDPSGDDEGKEQATLHNFSDAAVTLDGWRLCNRKQERHPLSGEIRAGETLTVCFPQGSLLLDNQGDELHLIDERDRVRHQVKYKVEMVRDGAVIAFRDEGDLDEFLLKTSQGVQSIYHTMHDDVLSPRAVDDEARIDGPSPPHVVYVVLESFRASAVSPELLKRLDAWSRKGLRMNRHYAGSNTSHLGLFALLYGRSPLAYNPTVDAGIAPQTTHTLRKSGYTCSFITSGDCTRFRKMDQFLNEDFFHHVILEGGADWHDWPDRDRRTLQRVRGIVQQAERPQFVMAFLMSTHFPYAFPPQWNLHQPSGEGVERGNWNTFDPQVLYNRYQNAALCLEDEVMRLIESLDPQRHIVVVTGDHGESMSEDGALAHPSRGSEVQTRVPLLMVGPGLPPQVIEQPTTHTDVLPTLLHALAGSEVKLANAHGRDVLAGGLLSEQVMILAFRWKDPYDLILMRGADRMQFQIRLDRASVEAFGFCDTLGNLDLNPARQCNPREARQWVEAFRREMVRIVR